MVMKPCPVMISAGTSDQWMMNPSPPTSSKDKNERVHGDDRRGHDRKVYWTPS